jgi:hypothetical protein
VKKYIIILTALSLFFLAGCQTQKVPNKTKIKKDIVEIAENFHACLRAQQSTKKCESFLAEETETITGMNEVKAELAEIKTYITDIRGISWEVPELGSVQENGENIYYLKGLIVMNDLTKLYLGYWLTIQNDELKIYGISIDAQFKNATSGFRELSVN